MTWHDVGPNDLDDGRPRTVTVGDRMVMLLRQGDAWHAVDAVCPHKFAMLADGALGNGCVTCPQHEATFDLTTGAPGDGEAWAGQLPVHEVRSADGRLKVRLNPC